MEPNKRFKSNSIAESQEIIRRHVNARREISTALSAEIISSASSTLIISPSGRRMRGSRPSEAQNRTLDEMNERIESSRQNTLGLRSAGNQRRHAAFKSIEQYWDYQHPCGHCGRVWLGGSTAGLRMKCCQGGRMWDLTAMPIYFTFDATSFGYWIF